MFYVCVFSQRRMLFWNSSSSARTDVYMNVGERKFCLAPERNRKSTFTDYTTLVLTCHYLANALNPNVVPQYMQEFPSVFSVMVPLIC